MGSLTRSAPVLWSQQTCRKSVNKWQENLQKLTRILIKSEWIKTKIFESARGEKKKNWLTNELNELTEDSFYNECQVNQFCTVIYILYVPHFKIFKFLSHMSHKLSNFSPKFSILLLNLHLFFIALYAAKYLWIGKIYRDTEKNLLYWN